MTATFFPVITSDDPPKPPNGWEWRLLGEVAQLKSGHTPSRREEDYWAGGDIPWLSLKDIRGLEGRYVLDTENKPTRKGIENTSAPILPQGTVAFCRTASVGKVVILGRDMATSQDFANWVCGPNLLPEYLYEALRASGGQFNKEKQGSTHKTIYMPTLGRFRVLLPPLPEQRRLVDILDKADAIRRKRKESIALTKELQRSAFLEMFGDPVTNPKEWSTVTLKEVASVITDGEHSTPKRESAGIKLLSARNVQNGFLDLQEEKVDHIPVSEWQRIRSRCAPTRGDVLVSCSGTIGRVTAVRIDEPFGLVRSVAMLRPKPDLILPDFLEALLSTPHLQRTMLGSVNQSAQANLFLGQIGRLPAMLPPLDVQQQFADMACRVRQLGEVQIRAAEAVDGLFSSLVQRAFRGEVTTSIGKSPHAPREEASDVRP